MKKYSSIRGEFIKEHIMPHKDGNLSIYEVEEPSGRKIMEIHEYNVLRDGIEINECLDLSRGDRRHMVEKVSEKYGLFSVCAWV